MWGLPGWKIQRIWEHVDSLPYPDSEESEDDIVDTDECENELVLINLRNEVTYPITVDTCGERCAQLDDFNWVRPTEECSEESDMPESEIDTPRIGDGVYLNTSDSSSPETETTRQQLSGAPVVAQTRPKGGCQTAMPRRKRRRRNVRTADSTSAMDISQESVTPRTEDSEKIHKMSECITKGGPKLEAAPPASHGMVQPNCSDYSRTDPLPLGSGRLGPAVHVSAAGKPPAEMNICNTLDTIQREMSVMLEKMADGNPPAEANIHTDSDTLQSKLSEMTVKSERWMERFIMNPQVVCSDSLTSDDNPEDRSLDVDGGDDLFQNSIPTVVSVRPEVTDKWMDRFVVDLVECPSVSRTSAVVRTFGPAVSEEYSPVVFLWGGGGCRCIPPGGRRVLPVAGFEYPCFRVDSEEALLKRTDERALLARAALGATPGMKLVTRSWIVARGVHEWHRKYEIRTSKDGVSLDAIRTGV